MGALSSRGSQIAAVTVAVMLLGGSRTLNAAEEAEALLRRAHQQHAQGRFDEAVQLLLRAERLTKEPRLRGRIRLELGVNRGVVGDMAGARQAFAAALDDDPALTLDPQRHKPALVRLFQQVKARRTSPPSRAPGPDGSSPAVPPGPPSSQPAAAPSGPQPPPAHGRLTVRTSPSGAKVFLDGSLLGRSPLVRTTVASGHHELLLRLPGHEDQYRQLSVDPAGEASVDVSLAARVPVLRPGTRRWLVSVGLGAALGASGAVHAGEVDISYPHQFAATQEVGFHFSRRSAGPGLSFYLVEAAGPFTFSDERISYERLATWSSFLIQPGLRFFWDIPLGGRGIYLTPALQVGYAYLHAGACEGVACGDDRTESSIQAVAAQPSLDLKLLFVDRVFLCVRPVAIEVLTIVTSSLAEGTSSDSVVIRYGLQVGVGVTF